jgi:hypothetical protein
MCILFFYDSISPGMVTSYLTINMNIKLSKHIGEVYCGHRDQLIYLQIYILLPSRQQSEIPKKAKNKNKNKNIMKAMGPAEAVITRPSTRVSWQN